MEKRPQIFSGMSNVSIFSFFAVSRSGFVDGPVIPVIITKFLLVAIRFFLHLSLK